LNTTVRATTIEICQKEPQGEKFTEVMRGEKIDITVFITDSRVALHCAKYDKGGGWVGDPLSSLVLNAGSKLLAARRRKGKVLLGQIRYEWLKAIGYSRKTGWLSSDTIRLFWTDTDEVNWYLDLTFPKNTDTEFMAHDILRRACRYRQEMTDEKDEVELKFYRDYLGGTRITPAEDSKNLSFIRFPNHYFAPRGEKNRPAWN
jgi:hypothetical protein